MTVACRFAAAVLLAGLVHAPALGATYSLTVFGAPTGDNNGSIGYSVNNAGEVVGIDPVLIPTLGFLWQNGTVTRTMDLPGGTDVSFPQAINASGQIAGYSRYGTGVNHAYLQTGNTIQDLGDLPGGAATSQAYGINAAGWVVGESSASTGTRGFVWNGTGLVDIGDLAGGANLSVARAINDNNLVVGYSSRTGAVDRAVSWTDGVLTDLGELPGGNDFSRALAVNNAGQIAGYSAMLGVGNISVNHGVIWDGGTLTDIGEMPGGSQFSILYGINEAGHAVGRSTNEVGDRAILWRDGTLYDLNDLLSNANGFELREAQDINDLGQIVGTGWDGTRLRAFILTPEGTVSAAPEPASLAVLAIGLLGLARARRGQLFPKARDSAKLAAN